MVLWFKITLIINCAGGIIKNSFSPGNKDDRKQLELMIKGLFGKIFGDSGYISQRLFQELMEKRSSYGYQNKEKHEK